MPDRDRTLCWYCAQWVPTDSVWTSFSFRNILHNSIHVSDTPTDAYTLKSTIQLGQYEVAAICTACNATLRKRTPCPTEEYVAMFEQEYDYYSLEMCDVDMKMMSLAEMEYTLGCWWRCYPILPASVLFPSHPMGLMYGYGWRMGAEMFMTGENADAFERRFETYGDAAILKEYEFAEPYFREMIRVDSKPAPGEFARKICNLYARISDIAVHKNGLSPEKVRKGFNSTV